MRVKMLANYGINMETRGVWLREGDEVEVSEELAQKLFTNNRAVPVVEDKAEKRTARKKVSE